MPIMETLKQFKCKNATIKLQMVDLKDNKNCLYLVTEKPNKKNAVWKDEEYKYWDIYEAKTKMLELIKFWL